MARTSESLKNGWRIFKDKIKKTIRALPAAGKVAGMTGNVPFFGARFIHWFYGWFSKLDPKADALNTAPGLAFALVGSVGVCTTSIVIRGFNMYRQETHKAAREEKAPNEVIPINPHDPYSQILANANFCHIGPHSRLQLTYKMTQLFSLIYMATSASSGYVSAFSLAQLISKFPGTEFESKCVDDQSHWWKLVTVHAAAAFLSYTSITSFKKYNLRRIREYYYEFVEEGAWRQISMASLIESFIGVSNNTLGVFFANKHMYEMFADNSLCHIGVHEIPHSVSAPLVWISAFTNFIIMSMMTLPAVHARNSRRQSTKIDDLLEQEELKHFKKYNLLIKASLWIDAIFTALTTFLCFVMLPTTATNDKELEALSYKWYMDVIGGMLALLALKNQLAVDFEAYMKELVAQHIDAGCADKSLHELLINHVPEMEMPTTASLSNDALYSDEDEALENGNYSPPRRISFFNTESPKSNALPSDNNEEDYSFNLMLDSPSNKALFASSRR